MFGRCKNNFFSGCLIFIQTTSLQELIEKLKMPSPAVLMKIAIAYLNDSSISLEDHYHALQELLVLVECIAQQC